MSRESCRCAAPPGRRSTPFRPGATVRRLQEPRTEEQRLKAGKGITKCRPFLRVEKDAEAFAACNALAEEIGPLHDPKDAFRIIQEAIGDEVSEVFGVMTLDIHLRFKSLAETGRGEASSVMAPMHPTLRAAINGGGNHAIIFHVHPSGIEAEPSDADRDTTDAFVKGFEAIDMPLFDHIIVGGDAKKRSFYSFRKEGDL